MRDELTLSAMAPSFPCLSAKPAVGLLAMLLSAWGSQVSSQGLNEASRPDGEALFAANCQACHNGAPASRAPTLESMRQSSPAVILNALLFGPMRPMGARLSGAERRAVAEYLGGAPLRGDSTGASRGVCTYAESFDAASAPAWNGWSPDAANTRFQRSESTGLTVDQIPALELRWAFGFPDAAVAWGAPSLVGGRVFVGSHNGTVYSLDAASGCIHWHFSADGGVRTAMTVADSSTGEMLVYFGDTAANAYALSAQDGRVIWQTKVEPHSAARITGSPVVYAGRVYVPMASYEESLGADPSYACCTFRGSVSALDAATGEILWRTFTMPFEAGPRGVSSEGVTLYGPAGAAVWSAPTIDTARGLLYIGTGNTYTGPGSPGSDAIMALDLDTGEVRWRNQLLADDIYITGCARDSANPNCAFQSGPDFDFGSSPILAVRPDGRDVIIAAQKSGVGWALDPDNEGAVLWRYRAGEGSAGGGMQWGSAVDSTHAYFPVADIYTGMPGGLHAVDLSSGRPVWYAPPLPPPPGCTSGGRGCSAALSAAITVIPGAVFAGSVDGMLRAYATTDGAVLWEYETNGEYDTVNGVPANGASIGGPGPVIADGILIVSSGYGAFGGRAGNVLLGFAVAGDEAD